MKSKLLIVNFLLIGGTIFLLLRLFQLQIIKGEKYYQLAEENRIRKIKIAGPRGIIFDRHGEILARNLPIFKIKEGDSQRVISRDEALELESQGKNENLYIDFGRLYPQDKEFAHVVGYVGEISEEELKTKNSKSKIYEIGDLIGKTGIEQYYEEKLRGKSGGELVEVDTQGKILRKIGKVEPIPGENLTLAIDANLQRIAALQMKGKKGAVIVSNAKTGEILVLYSSFSFDPNIFGKKDYGNLVQKLITDEDNRPLFNRAISGIYPPGSTFKIVTSVAGLEEKKITQNTLINDPGVIFIGPYKYANWYFTGYGKTEGEINIIRAIKRSTDTFFYKVGEMVGVEKLVFWAKEFGLDKTFGIDLPGEVAGFVPTPEWKLKTKGESWFLGNTYHFSIGQGDLALTPLGVNMMTAAIANGGKICQPKVVKIGAEEKIFCRQIKIKEETLRIVKEGMEEACSSGGTAWPFFEWNGSDSWVGKYGKIACKTGTAEYVDNNGKMKTHAWFTAFTKKTEIFPSIVITVLVEGGGEGSSVAAPIAKEILAEYFKEK